MRTPGGEVVLDETGRVAGRGAYLCRAADCWRAAAAKGALGRALGVPLPEAIGALLAAGPTGGPGTDMTMTDTTTTDEGGRRGQE